VVYYHTICTVKFHSSALVTISVGASKILGVQMIFVRISLNLLKKLLCDFCVQLFSHKDHELKTFFGVTSEKAFICFSAKLGRHFLKSNNIGCHLCPDFQLFCPDVQQIKTFGGDLATPPLTPLLATFHTIGKTRKQGEAI